MDDLSSLLAGILIGAGVLLVATVAVTVVLGLRLWRRRALLTGPDAPVGAKVLFWGAILYAVSPLDLLPDPILLDDIGVLLLGTAGALALARRSEASRATVPSTVVPQRVDIQDVPNWRGHPAPQDRVEAPYR